MRRLALRTGCARYSLASPGVRWIFWVNVPFCVGGLILAWRLMPAFPGAGKSRLDTVGLALISPGIAAVVEALAQVHAYGGFRHASVLVPLLAGVALIIAFTLRALAIGAQAVVDVRLFRVGSFSAATGLLFLSGFALYGAMLLVPLYFQQVRGQQAFAAGLLIAAQGLGVLASRGIAGRLTDRIGARWVAGLVVVAFATVPFALTTARTPEWLLVVTLVVRGIGLGAVHCRTRSGPRTRHRPAPSAGLGGLSAAFDVAFWCSIGFTVVAVLLALGCPLWRRRDAGLMGTPH